MPTRRTFDLIVIVFIGGHFVKGLFKQWATRVVNDADSGPVSQTVAGAVRIAS